MPAVDEYALQLVIKYSTLGHDATDCLEGFESDAAPHTDTHFNW